MCKTQTGPYPPDVTVEVKYAMSPPVVSATMTGHPHWPLNAISGFNVNITNISDGSLLSKTNLTNRCGNNTCTVSFSEWLPHSLSYHCTTLRVTATVVSDIDGSESDPTEEDVMIFKRKFARLRLS